MNNFGTWKEVECFDRVLHSSSMDLPPVHLDILHAAVHQQVIDSCWDEEQLSRPHLYLWSG